MISPNHEKWKNDCCSSVCPWMGQTRSMVGSCEGNLAATCTRNNVFSSETGRHSCYCSAEATQLCAIQWHGEVACV